MCCRLCEGCLCHYVRTGFLLWSLLATESHDQLSPRVLRSCDLLHIHQHLFQHGAPRLSQHRAQGVPPAIYQGRNYEQFSDDVTLHDKGFIICYLDLLVSETRESILWSCQLTSQDFEATDWWIELLRSHWMTHNLRWLWSYRLMSQDFEGSDSWVMAFKLLIRDSVLLKPLTDESRLWIYSLINQDDFEATDSRFRTWKLMTRQLRWIWSHWLMSQDFEGSDSIVETSFVVLFESKDLFFLTVNLTLWTIIIIAFSNGRWERHPIGRVGMVLSTKYVTHHGEAGVKCGGLWQERGCNDHKWCHTYFDFFHAY